MNNKTFPLKDIKVGDIIDNGSYHITKEEMIDFAQKYDPQFYHVDEAQAKDYIFGDLIASGWLTASIAMGLAVRTFSIEHGMIGTMVNLTWPNPTRAGDTLYLTTEVLGITPSKSKPNQAIVELKWLAKNQDDAPLLKTTSKLIMFYENPTNHSKNS